MRLARQRQRKAVALWRAIARYSALRRVMSRFDADRCYRIDLPELLGVALDRFAVDKKLIAARAFDPHAIQMSMLTKPLHRALGAGDTKMYEQFNCLCNGERVARCVAVVWRAIARCVAVYNFFFHALLSIACRKPTWIVHLALKGPAGQGSRKELTI